MNNDGINLKVSVDMEDLKDMKEELKKINELFPNIKVNVESIYITINHFSDDEE